MKYVIFSIDDQSPLGINQFIGYMRGCDTKGNVVPCVGSYKGQQEWSFMMLYEDFNKFVASQGFVDEQESILGVSECNKQYAVLIYKDGDREGLGSLKYVSQAEALKHESWTYRPDLNKYWIAVKGNPDTVPPREGWLSAEKKAAVRQAVFLLENDMCTGHNDAARELRKQFFPN